MNDIIMNRSFFKLKFIQNGFCNSILLLLFIPIVLSCSKQTVADPSEVLNREQQRVEFLTLNDFRQLSELLSPTMTYTHSNAVIENKQQFLDELESGRLVYRNLNHQDIQIRFVNPDVAILTGITDVSSTVEEQEVEVPLRFTIVYVNYDGQWLFEAWHSVRRPE